MNTHPEHVETLVIGGGQAGLSTGYHLTRRNRPFVIVDAQQRVGDNWRCHWDSLRLYSPAKLDGLPGMPFPAPRWTYPTKDQMADYLEEYATRFDLPVRSGVRVHRLTGADDGYLAETDAGRIEAENVVVATGTFGRDPYVPGFAGDLDPRIRQLHSSQYKRPGQLQPGPVLVVGASHSGADVAVEVGPEHFTVLSGPIHGEAPVNIEGRGAHIGWPLFFFLGHTVLTLKTPVGRGMRPEVRQHGGPLLRVKKRDLERVGVGWTPSKVAGVRNGQPLLEDGRVLDVANIVWCTGFRQHFEWIDLPVIGEDGWPEEDRGVVGSSPGLYFTGLAFQSGFTSMLVGGAGRDAEYVVDHLVSRTTRSRLGSQHAPVSAS